MSRQREWQKRKRAEGNCVICGKKRNHDKELCDKCHEARLERLREAYKRKRGGVVKSYKRRDKRHEGETDSGV